jgi:RNA polymerase sigma-70 factor (TIGR02960 family)
MSTDTMLEALTMDGMGEVAFSGLAERHRRELHVHCYRMLGSFEDAEDTVQETFLRAWRRRETFEGRSTFRAWLYRIATNACLDLLARCRPEPATGGEVLWLQPYPDPLLDQLPQPTPGPEARYESREAISLAFVTAVQLLPPNQRAVLLLRDVLGYRASEAAGLLGLTEDAVTSALKRARATMDAAHRPHPSPLPGPGERALLDRFVAAFTESDVEALVGLMTDDAWVRMPPLPFEYRGPDAARRFFTAVQDHRRAIARMVPTGANGQPAWGEYLRDSLTGRLHLVGILVVEVAGSQIREITHFETGTAPYFGLPRILD